MSVKLIKSYIETCPACRLLGKRYTPQTTLNDKYGYSRKWGEWRKNGWFELLEKLAFMPSVGERSINAMRVVNGSLYGLVTHNLRLEELRHRGWKRVEDDWGIERRNGPRFIAPYETGKVIRDYGILVEA